MKSQKNRRCIFIHGLPKGWEALKSHCVGSLEADIRTRNHYHGWPYYWGTHGGSTLLAFSPIYAAWTPFRLTCIGFSIALFRNKRQFSAVRLSGQLIDSPASTYSGGGAISAGGVRDGGELGVHGRWCVIWLKTNEGIVASGPFLLPIFC